MSNLFESMYNPDVLSCLANLSNDEVFTPPDIANQMLDLLPEDLWHDPNVTFLDPGCKSGVFLREIAKRLIKGLEDEYPDLQERLEHIFKYQLYGIAITELTSLLSRRSLYCSKFPNYKYSVVQFDDAEGNVRFRNHAHSWYAGRCKYCGISEKNILAAKERGETLEAHAYEFIHVESPERIMNMKFDVIVGNPPYQLSDGGNSASAMPIYQKFVQQAIKLNPRYMAMITPARWFVGGRGLDAFRSEMLNDRRLRVIHDFPNASDCFPGVEIKGGVCYYLWDRDNPGLCEIHTHENGKEYVDERPLLEDGLDVLIRTSNQLSVLNKIRAKSEPSVSPVINAGRFFGFHTRVTWDGESGRLQTADGSSSFSVRKTKSSDYSTKVYIANGECWIRPKDVTRNSAEVDRWKVLIPRSGNPSGSILGKPKLSEPGSCNSNTYTVVLFDSRDEAENFIAYLKTRFVRYMVSTRTVTQDMAPKSFEFVPMQNFGEKWDDARLYKKYGLSEDEVEAIEASIPEML